MDLKNLKIGSVITVTLTSKKLVIGEFCGYKDEPEVIILKNVRFLHEANKNSEQPYWKSDIVYEELLIECQNILKVDELGANSTSSLVHYDANQGHGNLSETSCAMTSLNWLPGRKPLRLLFRADIPKELQHSMRDYCKKLFETSNFAQLIIPVNSQSEIGLPNYINQLYREPLIPLMLNIKVKSNCMPEYEGSKVTETIEKSVENADANFENGTKISDFFEENACAMILPELLDFQNESNAEPVISVRQLTLEIDKLNLYEPMEIENAKSKVLAPPHNKFGPFLRYPNGDLYLNEEFFINLCGPVGKNAAVGNESLHMMDPTSFAMNCCQEVEE